jgi:hypothetical protein
MDALPINMGAIAETAEERQAMLFAIKDFPATAQANVTRVRERLEPRLPEYDVAGARHFHLFCDGLTVAFLWAKEWRRRKRELSASPRT